MSPADVTLRGHDDMQGQSAQVSPLNHCNYTLCERVCLAAYKMGVVAVETDRATSSGGLRPNTPPPGRALTPATRPSDPGGRSAGKKGGK